MEYFLQIWVYIIQSLRLVNFLYHVKSLISLRLRFLVCKYQAPRRVCFEFIKIFRPAFKVYLTYSSIQLRFYRL